MKNEYVDWEKVRAYSERMSRAEKVLVSKLYRDFLEGNDGFDEKDGFDVQKGYEVFMQAWVIAQTWNV